MKVLFIVGSYPPDKCGVGDYLFELVKKLKERNINVDVLSEKDWSFKNFLKLKKKIQLINPDFIHIQFPSAGFKFSIYPTLLSLMKNAVVTIHEVSKFHPIRRLYLFPFSLKAKLVFTNKYEQKYFYKYFPWTNKTSYVIPIGSNIQSKELATISKLSNNIVYFGQIRPNKGIEDLVKLANLIVQNQLHFNVIIAGQLLDRYKPYFDSLQQLSGFSNINWQLDLPMNEVQCLLGNNLICYLPFPDGASERRGSFLAALANKMLIFTTVGLQTPKEWEAVIIPVTSPHDVLMILKMKSKQDLISIASNKSTLIDEILFKHSWENIADNHIAIWKEIK